jgi:hypothetical protein
VAQPQMQLKSLKYKCAGETIHVNSCEFYRHQVLKTTCRISLNETVRAITSSAKGKNFDGRTNKNVDVAQPSHSCEFTSPGFTPLVSLSHPFQLGVQCSNASSFFNVFYTSFSKAHDAQGHHENWYQRRSIFRMAGLLQLPLPVRPANDDLRLVDPVQVNQL